MTSDNAVDRPAVAIDSGEAYHQLIHKNCAGSLVVVERRGEIAISCDRCRSVWRLGDPENDGAAVSPAEDWVRGTICVTDLPLNPVM